MGLAVSVTACPDEIVVSGLGEILTEGITVPLIDIVVVPDVSVAGLAQFALDVITQYTDALLASAGVVYVDPVPVGLPFKNHWYVGEPPPLVGVAVKDTVSPEHIVVDGEGDIDTDGVTVPLIVTVSLP